MSSEQKLRGNWRAISAVISGDVMPGSMVEMIRLTLTETRFTTHRGEETLFDSSYTADAAAFPKQIEMIGSGGDFEGKPALGIYSLEGETLQICYKMPGYPRPTDFTSESGSGAFLITLRRIAI